MWNGCMSIGDVHQACISRAVATTSCLYWSNKHLIDSIKDRKDGTDQLVEMAGLFFPVPAVSFR